MALLSIGGTSMVERCARARTRPLASSAATSSSSETGVAPARSCASASSTERRPLFMQVEVRGHELCDGGVVVQVEHRKLRPHRAVARHGDDMRVVRMQQAFAGRGAPYLELRDRSELESFDDDEVAWRQALHLLLEGRLVRAAELVHQHPAPRRSDEDLRGAGVAMAIRILAWLVDVEGVVGVLDERHAQASADEARDQLLDERGLAATRPTGKAEDLHYPILSRRAAARAAGPGGTAQAVLAECDAAPKRGVEVEIEDAEGLAPAAPGRELEHLVKVAIVDAPVVADAQQAAAHDALGRGGVERRRELVEVGLELTGLFEVQPEAVDRHVGEGVEPVERKAEFRLQLSLVVGFERRLRRRQVRSDRVVDQIEREPAPVGAVADRIQTPHRLDALAEYPGAPLRVGKVLLVIGQRGDHLDAMAREERGQVLLALPRLRMAVELHGEVM